MGRPDSTSRPRWPGWLPLLVLPTTVAALARPDWPAWAVMWAVAAAIFAGCKWLSWWATPAPGAPAWKHAGYLVGWPGLDATAFLTGPPVRRPGTREWAFAAGKLAFGVVVLWGLVPLLPHDLPLLRGWVGMVGVIFVLHFGSFHLLSCAWRAAGIDAKPLMRWPVLADGLSDFWANRWNTAFRDFTHRFLFRPLSSKLGPRWGLAAGFLFSGAAHDAVISWPADGGYGWPTLYFAVQGLGLLAERSRAGRRLGLGRGWRGWVFTFVVVAGPAFGLFHPPFVARVVLPFLDAIGAGGVS